jgi:LuxR family maltose regulon positive regulatory protein
MGGDARLISPDRVLVETKLQVPPVRDQILTRDGLLERLRASADLKLTLVACPAGFGKTSLLATWYRAENQRRPMAWLTVDKDDNDPAILWSYLLEALRRASPDLGVGGRVFLPSAAPVLELLLPQLVNALSEQGDVTLILDDFHLLTDGRARESIRWLVEHAPPTFQLVLSTRREPDLAMAALRAYGEVLELRADDLRFTHDEADLFLNGRQLLGLTSADVALLVERMDGWPAGLGLAALSLRRPEDKHELVSRFGASNRHVIDFLESEVLEAHDAVDSAFLVQCAVLERLCGSLCDAVLEQSGSVETLRRISHSNLFLVPLDDQGDWYRYHPVFAQLLKVKLSRRGTDLTTHLHRRAYEWNREHGDTTAAIHHALEAGMNAAASELVAATWPAQINAGRYKAVLSWIDRFPSDVANHDVRLQLARAWAYSMSGHQNEAAHCVKLAERLDGPDAGPLPDGFSSVESSLATLKGVFSWGNVREARGYAHRALELEGPGSPWHALACWAVAMAHLAHGDLTEADAMFAHATADAPKHEQWLVACAALAYRSLIADQLGRQELQAQLAEASGALALEHGLENNTAGPSMALGQSLNARGRHAEALPVLERGVVLARFQSQPLVLIRALRYLAGTLTVLGQHERAAAAAAEVRSVLAACVDPAAYAATFPSPPRNAREPDPFFNERLTQRELTVITLLAGDLSEAEIGRALFVSHSTIHSHVRSIYRKLGATTRAEAVTRAQSAGFLHTDSARRTR